MKGIITALVTPFDQDGKIDWESYQKLLKHQKAAQVAGVVACGTTGESPALSVDEKKKLIEVTLQELAGSKIDVIAGTGSNNTAESIELSMWASSKKVKAVLIVTPYYNKPSQDGLKNHFKAIADEIDCDLILYNVPGRTGVSLSAATVAELAAHPRITALKEATGNMGFLSEIRHELGLRKAKLHLLSGDDATFFPLLCLGGSGVISVASNLIPEAMNELYSAVCRSQMDEARGLQDRFFPLFKDLFVESNPAPLKFALEWAGLCGSTLRPPLAPLGEKSKAVVLRALENSGLKKGFLK